MKIFTCTPMKFEGRDAFFARESGLFSDALSRLGCESRAVLLGESDMISDPRVIRGSMSDLESKEWWAKHELQGVILYSWAAPKFNLVAKAIRDAGVPLLVNMDHCGLVSPRVNRRLWLREAHRRFLWESPTIAGRFRSILRATVEFVASPVAKRRLQHYRTASVVCPVTPHGLRWVPREAASLGEPDLASKFAYLPHPQDERFRYSGRLKDKIVISVGRWQRADWPQKDPRTLLKSLHLFLRENPDWRGIVVGSGASELEGRLGLAHHGLGSRLEFYDRLPPDDVRDLFDRAMIGFWTSVWEGQQGTGAQALCCGCSVVGMHSAMMSCFSHYVSRESGRLSFRHAPDAYADELTLEARSWESGHRDPDRISRIWCDEFHSERVAARALDLLGVRTNPRSSKI